MVCDRSQVDKNAQKLVDGSALARLRWQKIGGERENERRWTPADLSASEDARQDAWLLDPRDCPADKHCHRHLS